ncbi:MAG: hypothetical protein EHM47_07050 [Ignavibacteriales bacterium]|nr:MAG: hypothetical protein EHM47_07050 [Ignavibacteriales bacterium]
MTHKNILILLILFLIFNLFISCTDPVGPGVPGIPFVSLTVGDERQFMFNTDSSTILYKVKYEVLRSDGLQVFVYEWLYGEDSIPRLDYYALKDGFFIATELDTVRGTISYLPDNPFREQRIAKLYPQEGEVWQSIIGDSTSLFFTAKNIGVQKTPAGLFNNCYGFVLDNALSVNYAKGIGHVSSIFLSDNTGYVSTYIKVKSTTYGTKVPPKSPFIRGKNTDTNSINLFSLLLGKR